MITIRYATPHDAHALAQLAEETFRATFGPLNTAEDMILHCQTNYSPALQSQEIGNPKMVTLVCEHSGQLVGFAQLRWGEVPPCVVAAHPGEILRLYLAQDWHGQGLAQRLMQMCLEEIQGRGSDVAWLGVWEHNPRAIAFYQKCGFTEVGAHVFALGNDPQRDIVMVRPVG